MPRGYEASLTMSDSLFFCADVRCLRGIAFLFLERFQYRKCLFTRRSKTGYIIMVSMEQYAIDHGRLLKRSVLLPIPPTEWIRCDGERGGSVRFCLYFVKILPVHLEFLSDVYYNGTHRWKQPPTEGNSAICGSRRLPQVQRQTKRAAGKRITHSVTTAVNGSAFYYFVRRFSICALNQWLMQPSAM